jgi:hypothetical protein
VDLYVHSAIRLYGVVLSWNNAIDVDGIYMLFAFSYTWCVLNCGDRDLDGFTRLFLCLPKYGSV